MNNFDVLEDRIVQLLNKLKENHLLDIYISIFQNHLDYRLV